MYVNKCSKCGSDFDTKNPKRVICPNCLYPDKVASMPVAPEPKAAEPKDDSEPEVRKNYVETGQAPYQEGHRPRQYNNYNQQGRERSYDKPYDKPYNDRNRNYNNDRPYNDRPYNKTNNYQQRGSSGGYQQDRRDNAGYNQDRRDNGGYQQDRNSNGGYQQRNNSGYQQDRNSNGGYQQRNNSGYQQGGGYSDQRSNRPPQGGRPQGNYGRPPQGQGRPGGFQQRRPSGPGRPGGFGPKKPVKLLVNKDQLAQIELLYKPMLPLPNPDAHEVIAKQVDLEPRKVFFGINLVRLKMKLPKLPFPKRKLAVTSDQLTAIESLYTPLLPLPPIGCHKIIAKQLKMDEWRVHVGIGIIRKQMNLPRWNTEREDAPEEFKNKPEKELADTKAAEK